MATRTRTPDNPEAEALTDYVVVSDAVNVTIGKKPDGSLASTRLVHGETLTAPEGHPSVVELLAMGGIVVKSDLHASMKAVQKMGGPRRPTVVGTDTGPRLTAAGVAAVMGQGSDPEPVDETILPLPAPNPEV